MGTLSLAYSLTFIGYEEDKTFPCSYIDVYGDNWNGTDNKKCRNS